MIASDLEELYRRAAGQRAMVRWWAAECRQRNATCRRRFSAANVAAATEARAILRDYARAWAQTRDMMRGVMKPISDEKDSCGCRLHAPGGAAQPARTS